jgi:CubicO group peptidase (beta-lactamase class C family)
MVTDLQRRSLENRIDALIAPWRGVGPGVSIGVVRGGELIAHRHTGMASVEHGVPIGPETRFRIASVSKQFTCAAVLLLAARGRLDITAPARSLIPELPEAYAAVTVAQLMQNTAGIRDMLEIMRFGGADLGTPVTAAELLAGICRQRTLNFAPGTRFLYSNSNFFLLGLIVERIAGEALATFLARELFSPLGMTATQHTPDLRVPIPHLATGYLAQEGGIIRAPHAFTLGGEGGLVSSVIDLALWAANARDRAVPSPGVLRGLEQLTPFPNGTETIYARGLIRRAYRGVETISHGGLWPGFRTEYLRAPEHDVAVIAIANSGAIDPNALAHRVLDMVLDRAGAVPAPSLPPGTPLPEAGRYVSDVTGETLDIAVLDSGAVTLTSYGQAVTAEATEDGCLAVPRSSTVLAVRAAGPGAVEVRQDAGVVTIWKRAAEGAVLADDLPGIYASEEMDTRWEIARDTGAVAGAMTLHATGPVVRGAAWPLEAVTARDARAHIPGTLWRMWFDIRLERGADGRITGLTVNGGRAKAVRFARVG